VNQSLTRRFAHEFPRELLNRNRGHDPDRGRLGAKNDTSTDRRSGLTGDHILRILLVLFQLRDLRCAALMIIT
jgi:hypothetical protein